MLICCSLIFIMIINAFITMARVAASAASTIFKSIINIPTTHENEVEAMNFGSYDVSIRVLTILVVVIITVITLLLNVRIARAFGKGIGFAIGMTFIPVVFFPILAFSKNIELIIDNNEKNGTEQTKIE